MIAVAAVIVAAVAAGVAAQRRFEDRAAVLSRRILAVMLYVLVPPVVFFNLVHLELTADVGLGIVLAWVSDDLAGLIAHGVGARVLHLERPQQGTLINTTMHPNAGYLGLPVCAAALGTGSLDRAIAYDILVGTPTLLLGVFAVGAAFGTRAGETRRERARARRARRRLPRARLRAPAARLLRGRHHPRRRDPYLLAAAMPTGVNGLVVAHAYGLDVGRQASAVAYGTVIVVTAAVVVTLV